MQIGGPTGAFVVIVYGIVQKYGVDGLIVATMMAGVFLVILGAAKLGGVIKFIPHPVVIGFTSGIAVIIFSSQVKDLLGLQNGRGARGLSRKWGAFAEHIGIVQPVRGRRSRRSRSRSSCCGRRINPRIPGPFVALVALDGGRSSLLHLPVETIGIALRRDQRVVARIRRCRTSRSRTRSRSSVRRSRSRCSARSSRCSRRSSPTA